MPLAIGHRIEFLGSPGWGSGLKGKRGTIVGFAPDVNIHNEWVEDVWQIRLDEPREPRGHPTSDRCVLPISRIDSVRRIDLPPCAACDQFAQEDDYLCASCRDLTEEV